MSFVLALLCKLHKALEVETLDEGYLSAESCFGEERGFQECLRILKIMILDFIEGLKKHKEYAKNVKYLNFLTKKLILELLDSEGVKWDFSEELFLSDLKELDNYDGLVFFKYPFKG